MAKQPSHIDAFLALTDAEKAKQVQRLADSPSRPMTVRERADWNKVQARLQSDHKKKGRPVKGKGVKVISLSMERGLLARVDARAKREGVSRAQLVARGLETVLGK